MNQNKVVILIPLLTEVPSELEKISLQQTLNVLYKYDIVLQTPMNLNVSWYVDFCKGKANVFVERFQWKGHEQYSMLHTSAPFYQRFMKYEYLMICHLDAFVFRDEMEYWCSLDYDYIGSVIYKTTFVMKNTWLKIITTYTNPDYFGNGGFSLRKTKTFYDITSRFKLYIDFYHWQRKLRKRGFYDDLFHATHYPKLSSKYRVAPKSLAQKFGADFVMWDENDLPFTNKNVNSLPFGIHGWIKNQQEYWKPCIEQFGYSL